MKAIELRAALIAANGNGIIDKLAEDVIRITVPSNGAGVVDIDNALVGVGTVATGLTISYEAWLAQLRESGYLNFSNSKNTGNSNKGKKDKVNNKNSNSYMSNKEMNNIKNEILAGEDVEFNTKEEAIEFIRKKFPDFKQEVAGSRSNEGWHFDPEF